MWPAEGGRGSMIRKALGLLAIALSACEGGEPGGAPVPPAGRAPVCTVESDGALGGNEGSSPAVAFAGKTIAAAWSDAAGMHIATFDAAGKPLAEHTTAATHA